MAAKSSMLARKTFTLTTLSMVVPAPSRIAVRFFMHWCCNHRLATAKISHRDLPVGVSCTYGVRLDVTVNDLHRHRVHWHGAGAEDHAIGDDGLAVDARQGLGSLIGEDGGLGRGHICWLLVGGWCARLGKGC